MISLGGLIYLHSKVSGYAVRESNPGKIVRLPSEKGSTIKGKNLLQILFFYSRNFFRRDLAYSKVYIVDSRYLDV